MPRFYLQNLPNKIMESIPIKVVWKTGTIETIMLSDSKITEGHSLNVIRGSSIDHYFDENGFYDGWGKKCAPADGTGSSMKQAVTEIDAYSKHRMIE